MSLEHPHLVLGIDPQASPEEARRRYLALVRQFPPDRAAERFREIHAAYQAFTDPLIRAEALMGDQREAEKVRPWQEVIEQAAETPPRLAVAVLLALGNPWQESDADKPGER
jgi:curved DNA-binding protein CbpA